MHNQSSYSLITPSSSIGSCNFRLRDKVFLSGRRQLVKRILRSSRNEESDQSFAPVTFNQQKSQDISASTYITVFGILPVISFFAFDQLLKQVTDFNLAAIDRQLWIIALLLSKRLYIYAVALTTVDLAAKRSVDLPGSLGKVTLKVYNCSRITYYRLTLSTHSTSVRHKKILKLLKSYQMRDIHTAS